MAFMVAPVSPSVGVGFATFVSACAIVRYPPWRIANSNGYAATCNGDGVRPDGGGGRNEPNSLPVREAVPNWSAETLGYGRTPRATRAICPLCDHGGERMLCRPCAIDPRDSEPFYCCWAESH